MSRPDLRLKENRFLVPQPPDHLTSYQNRQWREQHLDELLQPSSKSPAVPPTAKGSATGVARAPLAKAAAVGSSCVQGGRCNPSLTSRCCKWLPTYVKGASGFTLLLTLALMSGQQGPIYQVARLVGAVADIGKATSAAAVQALNMTNQMAVAASSLVAVIATNGFSAGANLWQGLDFANIRASRCAGFVLTRDPSVLVAWLNIPEA